MSSFFLLKIHSQNYDLLLFHINGDFVDKLISIVILFCFSIGFSQNEKSNFKAFGMTPEIVSTELYKKLDHASTIEERCQYLDTIAKLFVRSGSADSVISYGQKLDKVLSFDQSQDSVLKTYKLKALLYKGIGARKIGFIDKATSSFIEGIEASNNHDYFQAYFKLELAQNYIIKELPEKAKTIIDELEIAEFHQDLYLKYLIVFSQYQILLKDFSLAEETIELGLSKKFSDNYIKTQLELELLSAKVKYYLNDFEDAISTSQSIKNQTLFHEIYDLYIEAVLIEGQSYVSLKQYRPAEVALSSAFINATQWNRLELKQKIIRALVNFYSLKEDYKNAFNLMTQYQAVSYTIAQNQNKLLVSDLELKYETLKKEKEIDKLQEDQLLKLSEIERQKTIKYALLIGFLIILVPVILLLVVYYQKLQAQSLLNAKTEAINKQEVQAIMRSQELKLANNTIHVQKKERDRIARELHDSIGGNLAAIKLKMNNLDENNQDKQNIIHQINQTYGQVREISHSLISKEIEKANFTELIENYIKNFNQNTDVEIRFNAYPDEVINNFDARLKTTLFNILKELIINAFKHAKAAEIDIQLTYVSENKSIELIYEDDGQGFDVDKMTKGIGLKNLENRMNELNGNFSVNSRIGRGTVISMSIPY